MMNTMIEAADNLTAASELARKLFDENRRMRAEINRLHALREDACSDVEISRGREFRLIKEDT